MKLHLKISLLVLVVLAVLGKSPVMMVSVIAIAVGLYITRASSLLTQLITTLFTGTLGSVIQMMGNALILQGVSVTELGGVFVSAILVGLVNVAAMAIVMSSHCLWKRKQLQAITCDDNE